jgi:hypothetical protein
MKKIFLSFLALLISTMAFSQIIALDEVYLTKNYKYITDLSNDETPTPVDELRKTVAFYDLKSSDIYDDEYSDYTVQFYIPDGQILAEYDKNGIITRTIERFKDVKLPKSVITSIAKRFPNWSIEKDLYKVTYLKGKGVTKAIYKVKLSNGNKILKVKTDEEGNFIK